MQKIFCSCKNLLYFCTLIRTFVRKSLLNMENNEFYTLLGKNISSIRNKKGYKQEDLANYLGLSRPSLVNIEKGNQKPSIFVVLSIAQYLNVNALELLPELPENNFESIRIVGLDVDKSILSRDSSLRDFLQTI